MQNRKCEKRARKTVFFLFPIFVFLVDRQECRYFFAHLGDV